MPCNSKGFYVYHCACANDLHGNVMYSIRILNSEYLSFFLDMPSSPRPKMPFNQRKIATYIHNICKWNIGSRGNKAVEAKEDSTQLQTLTSGAK